MEIGVPSELLGLDFVPGDVLGVLERLTRAGFDTWLVGGALRDHLLGLSPKDWDLAASAAPEQVKKLFRRVVPVGIRHGTVQVLTELREIEVTAFEPAGMAGILKDLARRDFTMNALALSYPEGVLIDPHSGREAMKRGRLDAVGDARLRFREDPLRIIRAARLASVYGFEAGEETVAGMREEAGGLDAVAGERIGDELRKLITGKNVAEALVLLKETGALDRILPELHAAAKARGGSAFAEDRFRETVSCVRLAPPGLRVRFAALLCRIAPGDGDARASAAAAETIMRRWRMSNREISEVAGLVRHQIPPGAENWSDPEVRRFIARAGVDFLDGLIALAAATRLSFGEGDPGGIEQLRARIREQKERITALSPQDLAVSGADVMELLGLARGPAVGAILRALFDAVAEDPALNEREKLMDFLREKYHKQR
jgi:tRNA nucleotidyltransferase (CCA-adding enzyme)